MFGFILSLLLCINGACFCFITPCNIMKVFKNRETLKEWYSEHTERIHHLYSTVNILLRLLSHVSTYPSIQAAWRILVPWPGTRDRTQIPAVEAGRPNRWTSSKFPRGFIFNMKNLFWSRLILVASPGSMLCTREHKRGNIPRWESEFPNFWRTRRTGKKYGFGF